MERQRPVTIRMGSRVAVPAIAQATGEDDPVELDVRVVVASARTEAPGDETTCPVSVFDRGPLQQPQRVDNDLCHVLSDIVVGFSQKTWRTTDFSHSWRC